MRATPVAANVKIQATRYIISGVLLVLLYSAIYWVAAVLLRTPPLLANTIAFSGNLVVGWLLHSRWTFRGAGNPSARRAAQYRFVVVNLAGYALNSFWVWLIVGRLGGPVALPLIPIALVTPVLSFLVNRRWTFG
jgi:putative flippase GtrA